MAVPSSACRKGPLAGAALASLLWAGSAMACAPESGGAPEEPPPEVVVVRIEGALDTGTQSQLQRAIRTAQRAGAVLVVELDTPGGAVDLMWQLANQIDAARSEGLQSVAWIHDMALSAGALVAIACERIYMRPQAVIGASAPVQQGPAGVGAIPDEVLREKVTSALRSSFRGWALKHGRDPVLAQSMVDPQVGARRVLVDGEPRIVTLDEWDDLKQTGVAIVDKGVIVERGQLLSLNGPEALGLGMADGIAESREQVLEKIGKSGARVADVVRTRSEGLAGFLDSIRYLLLVVAVLAAYTEFKAPGFGLPGILALTCFGLFLFGRYMVGLADIPHIVAVAVGLSLIAVEIFLLPGTLWPGIAGALLVVGGLVLADVTVDPTLPFALDRQLALDRAFRLTLGLTLAVIGCWGLSRVLPKTPGFSRLVLDAGPGTWEGSAVAEAAPVQEKRERLVGKLGTAITDLRPVGKVDMEGAQLEARAQGRAIDRGARVRVVEVRSGRLVVEAEERA